jgi:hypothetical protein
MVTIACLSLLSTIEAKPLVSPSGKPSRRAQLVEQTSSPSTRTRSFLLARTAAHQALVFRTRRQIALIAGDAGVEIIPARAILDAAPNHDSFPCMDGIHEKESYRRLIAALWLKAILAAH